MKPGSKIMALTRGALVETRMVTRNRIFGRKSRAMLGNCSDSVRVKSGPACALPSLVGGVTWILERQ